MLTLFGVVALTFMMAMYALEDRGRSFVFLFALGCVLSSVYGFASGAWPFGVVEAIWSGIALRRALTRRPGNDEGPEGPGTPTTPASNRLRLLPSGSDRVHELTPRGTGPLRPFGRTMLSGRCDGRSRGQRARTSLG